VTFLAADIDAFTEAGAIGIKSDRFLKLKKAKLAAAMQYAAASQARYTRTGDPNTGGFTDAERDDADKD
jgi:hypothetical protein